MDSCAEGCKNASSMFVYGKPGTRTCDQEGSCMCYCVPGDVDGSCTQKDSNVYNLYRFSSTATKAPTTAKPTSKYLHTIISMSCYGFKNTSASMFYCQYLSGEGQILNFKC